MPGAGAQPDRVVPHLRREGVCNDPVDERVPGNLRAVLRREVLPHRAEQEAPARRGADSGGAEVVRERLLHARRDLLAGEAGAVHRLPQNHFSDAHPGLLRHADALPQRHMPIVVVQFPCGLRNRFHAVSPYLTSVSISSSQIFKSEVMSCLPNPLARAAPQTSAPPCSPSGSASRAVLPFRRRAPGPCIPNPPRSRPRRTSF